MPAFAGMAVWIFGTDLRGSVLSIFLRKETNITSRSRPHPASCFPGLRVFVKGFVDSQFRLLQVVSTGGRKSSPHCHPERSEGSLIAREMLRSAQHDRLGTDLCCDVLVVRDGKYEIGALTLGFIPDIAAMLFEDLFGQIETQADTKGSTLAADADAAKF
jgi:hypothetical protein